jgi:competence protein ComEC
VGPGHRLRFELATPPPPDGTWVAVLPGGDVVPPPRGPAPGPGASERTVATSHVHPDELLVGPRTRASSATWAAAWARVLRTRLEERAAGLESAGPARGLVRALLTGDRRAVAPETLDLFTRTGTRHLLALSGLHVGLLAGALLLPLTALLARLPPLSLGAARTRRRVVTALRLALLLGYVVLVGAGDPVTRAGAAVALALLGPHVRRSGDAAWERGHRPDALSVWSLALTLEVLVEPRGLERTSLRLSYLATLGILVGTGPLVRGLRALVTRDGLGGLAQATGGARLLARALSARAGRAAGTAVAASVAAVVATLPEVWARFGEVSSVGILATPLALPLLTLLLLLSWAAVLLPTPLLDALVPRAAEGLVTLLGALDRLPGTPTPLPPRPAALVAGGALLLFLSLRRARWRRPAALLWGVLLLPWSAAPRGLELFLLDVGHGTSALLRAPGLPALVFDAGSRDRRRLVTEAIAPLLARWEVRRPWVVLSHEHADHRSALPRLAARFPPALLLGARGSGGAARIDLEEGGLWLALPGPLGLRLLRGEQDAGNEGSRTLVVRWRDEVLVLTGDAEEEGLARLLDQERITGPVRLLLAPHHGADGPSTGRLLDTLRPEEVWVSASRPPGVARELERRDLIWAWTRDGPLELALP